MQAVGTVVLRQLVGVAVHLDAAAGQPVGVASDDGAEIGEVVLRQVVLRSVEALHHIGATHFEPHNSTAKVGDNSL